MSLTIKKILSSKGLKFPEKWWNQNFLVICPSTHCVLNAYKVSQNSMLRYKRICTYKPFIIKFNIWPKFKRAEIPRNIIMESEFPSNLHSCRLFINTYKVSLNSLQWFKKSCAYKKTRLTDQSKTLHPKLQPHCVEYNRVKLAWIHLEYQ